MQRNLSGNSRFISDWARTNVTKVCGLAVPTLIGFSRELLVIEMTMVQPPFLLDFAEARLDEPLEFPETEEETWARFADDFGDRLGDAQSVCYVLSSRYGIYYYDIAPRNMNFENFPCS
jgi:hypothetical protein